MQARGGFTGSFRILLRKLQELGLAGTILKLNQTLLWDSELGVTRNYRQWFARNQCQQAGNAINLFQRPSVLLVGSLDLTQCRKYRMLQKLEAFVSMDVPVELSNYLDCIRVMSALQVCTHVLFYRIPLTDVTKQYFDEARRLGLHVSYDIDDPIFDRATYAANKNLDSLSSSERDHLLQSSGAYLKALLLADQFFTSTPALARLMEKHTGKPAKVWPNLLDGESWSIIREVERLAPPADSSAVCRIGYMSGSRAHDADFALVAGVLARLLEKHPQVQLMLGGHFTLPACLQPFSGQIIELPFAGYAAYFKQLRNLDINIVPLLMDEFNNCKSAIRYLESAAVGVPSVASRIGEFAEAVVHGETGYLADCPEDWVLHLDALVTDSALRKRLGSAAQLQMRERFSLHSRHPALQDCVHSLGIDTSASAVSHRLMPA
jgi:glycosyltransferase involved in cell wall biosynthesis